MKTITSNDISTRMFLSPLGDIHDCTAQGHERFASDSHASLKKGWIRLVFFSGYDGQRLVVEAAKVTENQAIAIAQIVRVSKVQTTSLYNAKGDETRVFGSSIKRHIVEVYN